MRFSPFHARPDACRNPARPQEELLNSRDMEQQGRELINSMRGAEAHQRGGDGRGMHDMLHPAAHSAGPPLPEFAGFPKPEQT